MLVNIDPTTKIFLGRKERQKQAAFNLTIGLVLGGSISFLVIEFIKGVCV